MNVDIFHVFSSFINHKFITTAFKTDFNGKHKYLSRQYQRRITFVPIKQLFAEVLTEVFYIEPLIEPNEEKIEKSD